MYFVILFFLFPLRRTILKCEKKFFLCYRDQKKWIKGKVCQLEAEGRELVMFPRFTFSDRDNIGNVFEHFKIVIRSERNRKNNATECFFAFFLTFLRQKKKMTGKKKTPRPEKHFMRKNFFSTPRPEKIFFPHKVFFWSRRGKMVTWPT